MKKICRNCHFLCEYDNDNVRMVTKEERQRFESGKLEPSDWGFNHPKCFHNVWDHLKLPKDIKLLKEVNERNRDNCFFYNFRPEFQLDAAVEIQKRESDYDRLKRSNMYTRIGLLIAAGAATIQAAVSYIEHFIEK